MPRYDSVLLVDDDDVDNMLHRRILNRADFAGRVDAVRTGARALAYLSETDDRDRPPPDVLFLDLNMPLMDGFEFLEAVGADPALVSRTSIYVLTSSENERDRERATSSPLVRGYFQKPLTAEQLATT